MFKGDSFRSSFVKNNVWILVAECGTERIDIIFEFVVVVRFCNACTIHLLNSYDISSEKHLNTLSWHGSIYFLTHPPLSRGKFSDSTLDLVTVRFNLIWRFMGLELVRFIFYPRLSGCILHMWVSVCGGGEEKMKIFIWYIIINILACALLCTLSSALN